MKLRGTAAPSRSSIVVPRVNEFSGHVACDAASRSGLVAPLIAGDELVGVPDLDSPSADRFDDDDRVGCEALAAIFVAASKEGG